MEQFVSFDVAGKTLRGILHVPQGGVSGSSGIVICHGFCGTKIGMHRLFVKAARAFCMAGYTVLRFDFSGSGDSDGSYEQITIEGQVAEAGAALDLVRSIIGEGAQLYLIGHSLGGAVASLTSWHREDLNGLVLWAPVAKLYQDIGRIVGEKFFQQVMATGIRDYEGYEIGRGFVESLARNYPLGAAGNYRGPALVIFGTGDQDLPWQNAYQYWNARRFSHFTTQVRIIPDADHTFSTLRWEEEVFRQTLRWLVDGGDTSEDDVPASREELTG